jgi:hypothetical protein
VEPVIANLSKRADEIANAEFARLGRQPAGDDFDGDMSQAAEAAHEKGQAYYDTMNSIQQATLNLFAAGLFHLLEQQLTEVCHDGAFDEAPPKESRLEVVASWYCKHFGLHFSALASWPKVNQLRLLANAIKHGEGSSARELRILRPDLFQDPAIRKLMPDLVAMLPPLQLRLPLAGEGIFVTKEVFAEFANNTDRFITEIAQYFLKNRDTHYPVSSYSPDRFK